MHDIRDSIASLYVAWIPKLQSYIFATTEQLIEKVCEGLKVKYGPIDKVDNNIYMVFKGNELVKQQVINPRGTEYRQAQWASHSLGHEIKGTVTPLKTQDSIIDAIINSDDAAMDEVIAELDNVDDTYIIADGYGRSITAQEFHKLAEVNKLDCEVMRPDGTIINTDCLWDAFYKSS